MRQCSCLNTVLSGPADTMGVPGEHCGQCKSIQCWLRLWCFTIGVAMLRLSKQQLFSFHWVSISPRWPPLTMSIQIEHLHARWTIPDRGGFRSYPCHCQCHLEMFEYRFVSTSKSARFMLCAGQYYWFAGGHLIRTSSQGNPRLSSFQTFVELRLLSNSDWCHLMCSWAHGDSRLEGWRGKPEV